MWKEYLAFQKNIKEEVAAGKMSELDGLTQINSHPLQRQIQELGIKFGKANAAAEGWAERTREMAHKELAIKDREPSEHFTGKFSPYFSDKEMESLRSDQEKQGAAVFKSSVKEAERFLQRTFREVWGSTPGFKVSYQPLEAGARAFHTGIEMISPIEPAAGKTPHSFMSLPLGVSAATVLHEWGHAIEHQRREVHEAALDFLNKRVGDEPVKGLREVTGIGSYAPDEKGRKDEFDKAFDEKEAWYVGKDYGGRATEVVSMGMEKLWNHPVSFAKNDPEYFNFIINVLHGRLQR